MAAADKFDIRIKGIGGHGAAPQGTVDSIVIASYLIQALQTIVSRKLAPGAGAVVSVTEFLTDGQRNVLPGTAQLKGDVRARSREDRRKVEEFMQQIIEGISAAHGVSSDFSFKTEFIETINSDAPTMAATGVAQSLGLETIGDREPMSFSEDFAHFNAAVPGCFLLLGNGENGRFARPLHANNYDFNDALLPIGAKFWAKLVQDRLPMNKQSGVS